MTVHAQRIRKLNQRAMVPMGEYVLYWMQSSVRVSFNHALEHALSLANSTKRPLIVCFGVFEKFPEANERMFAFLLEGLQDVAEALKSRGLQFIVGHSSPVELVTALSANASTIVVDKAYTRLPREWRQTVAASVECEMIEVESDVVVPVEVTSEEQEYAARTIRKKIESQLGEFMKPVDAEPVLISSVGIKLDLQGIKLLDLETGLDLLDVDRTVPAVTRFQGGYTNAKLILDKFISSRLKYYATQRNEPSLEYSSDLSPYLHFGHISPIEIALAVKAVKKPSLSESIASFLEELIVRRELSVNFCYYNPGYDKYDHVLPKFARVTLLDHSNDPREYQYTLAEFESANTHDPYWNAAQLEMVLTGKMDNYLRMYWVKKFIEWTESPQQAYEWCLYLNNKYELDGRDVNSYVGVGWIFGLHDQGWKERAIFGKVRYMNSQGLQRKFDMESYVLKVDSLLESCENLPEVLKASIDRPECPVKRKRRKKA